MKELEIILDDLQEQEKQLRSNGNLFYNRGSESEAKRLYMQANLLNRAIQLLVEGMTKYDESGNIGKAYF